MNAESPENNFINFIKSNSKIFIYATTILFLIVMLSSWFFYESKQEKIKISENFIRAKILLENKNEKEATKILKEIVEKKKHNLLKPLSFFANR